MSDVLAQAGFYTMAVLAVAGAVAVVFAREVMRMALGLAVFLLATAGLFLYYGVSFLAAAQVFVYVGGVLVLMLFAIMMLRRSGSGVPDLASRHDVVSGIMCAMFFGFGSWLLVRGAPAGAPSALEAGTGELARTLLGPMLPQFEMLGALLLIALVAVMAVVGGERR